MRKVRKIIVQIDWYTKIILTLIAVLLAGLLAKPYIATNPVSASGDYVTIQNTWGNPVPVTVVDTVEVDGDVDVRAEVEAYVTNWP